MTGGGIVPIGNRIRGLGLAASAAAQDEQDGNLSCPHIGRIVDYLLRDGRAGRRDDLAIVVVLYKRDEFLVAACHPLPDR